MTFEHLVGGPGVTAYKKKDEELEEYMVKGGAKVQVASKFLHN